MSQNNFGVKSTQDAKDGGGICRGHVSGNKDIGKSLFFYFLLWLSLKIIFHQRSTIELLWRDHHRKWQLLFDGIDFNAAGSKAGRALG